GNKQGYSKCGYKMREYFRNVHFSASLGIGKRLEVPAVGTPRLYNRIRRFRPDIWEKRAFRSKMIQASRAITAGLGAAFPACQRPRGKRGTPDLPNNSACFIQPPRLRLYPGRRMAGTRTGRRGIMTVGYMSVLSADAFAKFITCTRADGVLPLS